MGSDLVSGPEYLAAIPVRHNHVPAEGRHARHTEDRRLKGYLMALAAVIAAGIAVGAFAASAYVIAVWAVRR